MEKLKLTLAGLSECDYDPVAHGRMRADTLNALEGELKGYECRKCRNRGMIAYPREDGSIFTRECSCMTMRRCMWEMERSGLKSSIREQTFEAFQAKECWQRTLKQSVQRYAQDPKGWLMLGGQSGCGKTHLCTAVCRQLLLSGKAVRYMPWREKISQLKALSLDSSEREQLMDGFKNAQVLYIDDLYKTGRGQDGTDLPTSADISIAFEIINHRYLNRLTTILSTEKLPHELVSIDEATASRIIELADANVYSIDRNRQRNYRMRNVVNL